MRLTILLLAGLACAATVPATAGGGVYQWKDANGVTHFSDAPPPKGTFQARNVDAGTGHAATPAAAESKDCTQARTNLALLDSDRQVGVDSDRDGKLDKPMSAEERAHQRDLTNADIKAYCGSPAAATP